MTTGDEPMLHQPNDEDNSPMLSSNRLLMDARAAYESGWLFGLTERMSKAQQLRFRQAVVGQGLHYFWNSIIITDLMDEEQYYIFKVGEWVNEPTPENFHAVDDQVRSFILRRDDALPLTYDDVYEACEGLNRAEDVAELCYSMLAESIQEAAQSAVQLARMTIIEPWREGEFDYEFEYEEEDGEEGPPPQRRSRLDDIPRRRAEAQRWQIEAAWAILHDDPRPPYPRLRPW